VGGIAASLWLDTPAGPTIVMVLALMFALSLLRGVFGGTD
jgi:ABC-type Mn2+/Zn2+ transport system permease subunit